MKRVIWITLLAVVAFAVFLLVRLPASWVVSSPPANISCTGVDGTIWSGACSGLVVSGQPVGDVVWDIHPSRLLAGKLAAHVAVTRPSASASGDVEVGLDKNLIVRNMRADLPLDRALFPQLPPNLAGNVHAEMALVRAEKEAIKELKGHIEARHLVEGSGGESTPLGSYSLTFPGGTGVQTGQLRDLGGPLQFEGTLSLTPEPGFDLQGLVKARPDAPASLTQNLRMLGSPDAQGRRQFSLSNTF
jgi:general secretion pathway protein N